MQKQIFFFNFDETSMNQKAWSNYDRTPFYIFVSWWLVYFACYLCISSLACTVQRSLHLWHSKCCTNCWPLSLVALEKTLAGSAPLGHCLFIQTVAGWVYKALLITGPCHILPKIPGHCQPTWCSKTLTEAPSLCDYTLMRVIPFLSDTKKSSTPQNPSTPAPRASCTLASLCIGSVTWPT